MVGILPGRDGSVGESVTSTLRRELGSTQEYRTMTLGKESHGVQLAMQGIASVGDKMSTAPIEGNVSNDIQQ